MKQNASITKRELKHFTPASAAKPQSRSTAQQGNNQDLTDLNTKIDRVLVLLNEIHQRISGQGSLDVET